MAVAKAWKAVNTREQQMTFRPAIIADVARIVALVNSAYRGESSRAGWTTEVDLLGGQRTDAEEVANLISSADSIILLCLNGDEIIGSVHLQHGKHREPLIQSNMDCVQTKTGLIKAHDAGRSHDYDAKECNAEQACFRLNPEGRGIAGAMRCRDSLVQNDCTARLFPCLASRNAPSQPCLIESVVPKAYLGMLVIQPRMQGQGVGKKFMQAAEATAIKMWGVDKMLMYVITLRQELIAFYQRRGYQRTGKIKKFPQDIRFGIPKVAGLQIELLEKTL